jgi:hypothetical protein
MLLLSQSAASCGNRRRPNVSKLTRAGTELLFCKGHKTESEYGHGNESFWNIPCASLDLEKSI